MWSDGNLVQRNQCGGAFQAMWHSMVSWRPDADLMRSCTRVQDEVLIAGFGRRGHAVGDIPGVRFKVGAPLVLYDDCMQHTSGAWARPSLCAPQNVVIVLQLGSVSDRHVIAAIIVMLLSCGRGQSMAQPRQRYG